MPTIRVELFEGRTVEQKRALAKALTEATVNTLGGSADSVNVMFFDIARHDWASGGTLWSDDRPRAVSVTPSAATQPDTARSDAAAGGVSC
jgi:4-oxalocrotonate tautomerase